MDLNSKCRINQSNGVQDLKQPVWGSEQYKVGQSGGMKSRSFNILAWNGTVWAIYKSGSV